LKQRNAVVGLLKQNLQEFVSLRDNELTDSDLLKLVEAEMSKKQNGKETLRRKEALQRLEKSNFMSSKMYRNWLKIPTYRSSEEYEEQLARLKKEWMTYVSAQIEILKKKVV